MENNKKQNIKLHQTHTQNDNNNNNNNNNKPNAFPNATYIGKDHRPAIDGADSDSSDKGFESTNVELVDSAIKDTLWWAYLIALELLCEILRRLFFRSESCSCHGHLFGKLAGVHIFLSGAS